MTLSLPPSPAARFGGLINSKLQAAKSKAELRNAQLEQQLKDFRAANLSTDDFSVSGKRAELQRAQLQASIAKANFDTATLGQTTIDATNHLKQNQANEVFSKIQVNNGQAQKLKADLDNIKAATQINQQNLKTAIHNTAKAKSEATKSQVEADTAVFYNKAGGNSSYIS